LIKDAVQDALNNYDNRVFRGDFLKRLTQLFAKKKIKLEPDSR